MNRFSVSRKRLSMILVILLLTYIASTAPVARWVITPLLSSDNIKTFSEYDRRFDLYCHIYAPVLWARNRSELLDSGFGAYEASIRPRRPSTLNYDLPETFENRLVTRSLYLNFGLAGRPIPTVFVDERDFLHSLGLDLPAGGFAYSLPRSRRFIVRATQQYIDMIDTLISTEGPHWILSRAAEANFD